MKRSSIRFAALLLAASILPLPAVSAAKEKSYKQTLWEDTKTVVGEGAKEGVGKLIEVLEKNYAYEAAKAHMIMTDAANESAKITSHMNALPGTMKDLGKVTGAHWMASADQTRRSAHWLRQYNAMKGTMKAWKYAGNTLSVVSGALDAYDMWDKPQVGYKSSFLEFLANTTRGMSSSASVLAPTVPGLGSLVALGAGAVKTVVTSETAVKFANNLYDNGTGIWVIDKVGGGIGWFTNEATDFMNWGIQRGFKWMLTDGKQKEKEAQAKEMARAEHERREAEKAQKAEEAKKAEEARKAAEEKAQKAEEERKAAEERAKAEAEKETAEKAKEEAEKARAEEEKAKEEAEKAKEEEEKIKEEEEKAKAAEELAEKLKEEIEEKKEEKSDGKPRPSGKDKNKDKEQADKDKPGYGDGDDPGYRDEDDPGYGDEYDPGKRKEPPLEEEEEVKLELAGLLGSWDGKINVVSVTPTDAYRSRMRQDVQADWDNFASYFDQELEAGYSVEDCISKYIKENEEIVSAFFTDTMDGQYTLRSEAPESGRFTLSMPPYKGSAVWRGDTNWESVTGSYKDEVLSVEGDVMTGRLDALAEKERGIMLLGTDLTMLMKAEGITLFEIRYDITMTKK